MAITVSDDPNYKDNSGILGVHVVTKDEAMQYGGGQYDPVQDTVDSSYSHAGSSTGGSSNGGGGYSGGSSNGGGGYSGGSYDEDNGGSYVVQPGDTLGQIAADHGTTVEELMEANGISNPDFIQAGWTLNVGGSDDEYEEDDEESAGSDDDEDEEDDEESAGSDDDEDEEDDEESAGSDDEGHRGRKHGHRRWHFGRRRNGGDDSENSEVNGWQGHGHHRHHDRHGNGSQPDQENPGDNQAIGYGGSSTEGSNNDYQPKDDNFAVKESYMGGGTEELDPNDTQATTPIDVVTMTDQR